MSTIVDHETQRSVWVPRLIAWAERERDNYEAAAHAQRQNGRLNNAAGFLSVAAKYSMAIARARVLLVELEFPTQAVGLADACAATDEPPRELVPFVDWLKLRFGGLLPGLSVETWQAIGCLILMARGIRP